MGEQVLAMLLTCAVCVLCMCGRRGAVDSSSGRTRIVPEATCRALKAQAGTLPSYSAAHCRESFTDPAFGFCFAAVERRGPMGNVLSADEPAWRAPLLAALDAAARRHFQNDDTLHSAAAAALRGTTSFVSLAEDPDSVDDGDTLLHCAVRLRCKPAVRALLDAGADVNIISTCLSNVKRVHVDADGAVERTSHCTPLRLAVEDSHDDVELVRLLVNHGAFIHSVDGTGAAVRDTLDGYGRSALFYASAAGNVAVAQTLLAAGAHVVDPNCAPDDTARNSLWAAVRGGHLPVAHLLLQCGARAPARDDLGVSPLLRMCVAHCSVGMGEMLLLYTPPDAPLISDAEQELMPYLASPREMEPAFLPPMEGMTSLLMDAICCPARDAASRARWVKLALEFGADAADTELQPLLTAVSMGEPDVVEALLMYGADSNSYTVTRVDASSELSWPMAVPILSAAVCLRNATVATLLLRYGADVDGVVRGVAAGANVSPLFHACNVVACECIMLLLARGASTRLHAHHGVHVHVSLLRVLLHAIPVHATGRANSTALRGAILSLVAHGATQDMQHIPARRHELVCGKRRELFLEDLLHTHALHSSGRADAAHRRWVYSVMQEHAWLLRRAAVLCRWRAQVRTQEFDKAAIHGRSRVSELDDGSDVSEMGGDCD